MGVAGSVPLEIRVMGDVTVAVDGHPVTRFESATTLALLCRLAVDLGRPIRRDVLAELLWPGRPAGRALGNLRHTLTTLRRALCDSDPDRPLVAAVGDGLVVVDEHTWVDLVEFRRPTRSGDPACRATLAQAYALRRGPTLAGMDAKLSPEWGQWVAGVRAAVDREVALVLDRLTDPVAAGDPPRALIPLAREWVELDRWNERAHTRLIRLLAADGRSVEALDHAERFISALSEQHGLRPDADLRSAVADVRAGRTGRPSA